MGGPGAHRTRRTGKVSVSEGLIPGVVVTGAATLGSLRPGYGSIPRRGTAAIMPEMALADTARRIRGRLADLVIADTSNLTRSHQAALQFLRFILYTGRRLARGQSPIRAAALAYATVLSLVPIIALFVFYSKVVGKLDTLSGTVQDWILRSLLADAAKDVTLYIDQFVQNLHTKAVGSLGLAGLLLTAYMLFDAVEKTFNHIWGVRKHRSLVSRFEILCSILVIVPAFLIASAYLTGKSQGLTLVGSGQDLTAGMRTVLVAAPFLLTIVPLFFLYKLVPNTHVGFKPALLGGFLASILLELAKIGFNFYVLHFVTASKIYGSLGLFPVFLIWIYYSWLVILFGAEVTFTAQNLKTLHEEDVREHRVDPLAVPLHEEWGLLVFRRLLQRFRQSGGPVTLDALASDHLLSRDHIEDHLTVLQEAGWIMEAAQGETRGYVPNRPLEAFTDEALRRLFRSRLGLPDEDQPGDGPVPPAP